MEGERLGRIRDEEFWSALHKAISPGHHPNRRPITPVLCHPRFSFPPSSRCPALPKPFLTYVPARVPPSTPASPPRSSPETWHSYTRTRTCTFVVRTQQPVSPTFPSHDSTPPSPSRPPSPCVLRVHRGHVHLSSSLTGFITYPSAEHQQPAREYVNAPRCPSAHPPAAGLRPPPPPPVCPARARTHRPGYPKSNLVCGQATLRRSPCAPSARRAIFACFSPFSCLLFQIPHLGPSPQPRSRAPQHDLSRTLRSVRTLHADRSPGPITATAKTKTQTQTDPDDSPLRHAAHIPT